MCGEKFETNLSFQKYCSNKCKNKYNYLKQKTKRTYKTGKCIVCGKIFLRQPGNKKCCSKECSAIFRQNYRKEYNQKHQNELKENRQKHKQKAKEYNIKYRKENKERLRQKRREYESTHKEQIRRYRAKNKHKFKSCQSEYFKEYYQEHAEIIKKNAVKSKRKQRLNPQVKIRDIISKQINFGLKQYNKNKNFKTFDIIDYTIEDLINRLESLFQDGMNWNNYGQKGWHIDHIKPVASFKLINEDGSINYEEIKKCWALENLQPLWAKDNISKSSWYIDENGNMKKYMYK